ncbi:hypothetical protein Rhopal_001663-T1 [Rhodotorula paludigena]|uniref:Formamidopyrimidine-DNA glycosylase catalytic domain-containing protein n=1 Tax=Rhodotorula paludigena TaxID=86838 RepID=A0AAV5GH81_9BASI|nr:hypothetical protein Rhopal_001663-T1 [Rhodotorula paludigena]
MPELPEVEAARKKLEKLAQGKRIKTVQTNEDSIVFSGTTHANFATSVEGKTVQAVRRLGKNFYLVLSSPPHPIFHFGMSGMAHVRGQSSPVYRVPRSKSPDSEEWPPKYMKTWITFEGDDGKTGDWAFCDPRRLGRIKLVQSEADQLEKVPPLSELDYMVDEILYQSHISALFATLHQQISTVTRTAVSVDADASRFPNTWLFQFRWGKGKKKAQGDEGFKLPDGSTSPISFITVGGRTSAVVDKVQILPPAFAGGSGRGKKRGSGDKSAGPKRSKPKGQKEEENEEDGIKKSEDYEDTSRGEIASPACLVALTAPWYMLTSA